MKSNSTPHLSRFSPLVRDYACEQGNLKMARVMVRLLDEAENPYDFFIGEAANCPPIPRVGDHVDYHLGVGLVKEVLHIYEEGPNVEAYRIAIKLEMVR